jgi:4-amino-4-deoxy-L-arabinose transferase-like glycosyltransferase
VPPVTSDGAPSVASPPGRRSPWWVRPGRPAWALPAQLAVVVLAAVLYTWALSSNGMANAFYAAAVKSGTESWKAFFFGSLDPGNFITVDKPPASLWVMELSSRVFGFSSWSMLLPQALAGVATVGVLYHVVRRWAGEVAALLAGLAMALMPIAVVIFRDNQPDAFLTLLLVLGAWAIWSGLETAKTSRLVLCGILLGLAFDTKMLQAFLVVPAFGLAYLWAGRPRLRRRVVQLLWGGLALLVSSSWWVAIVELWPASSRPFIGDSTDNSELNLIFSSNGFGRVFGGGGPLGGIGSFGGGSLGTGGQPGWLRMFNDLVGGQVSWLLPLALIGLVAGLGMTIRGSRQDRRRAGFVLWGGWVLCTAIVFDTAKGIFNGWYTIALAPAVAALAGAGVVVLWQLGRQHWWLAPALPLSIVGTAVWAAVLLGRSPGYAPGLATGIVVAAVVATVGVLIALLGGRGRGLPLGRDRGWDGSDARAPGRAPRLLGHDHPGGNRGAPRHGRSTHDRRSGSGSGGRPSYLARLRPPDGPRRFPSSGQAGPLPPAPPRRRRVPAGGIRFLDGRSLHHLLGSARHGHGRVHGPRSLADPLDFQGHGRRGKDPLRARW